MGMSLMPVSQSYAYKNANSINGVNTKPVDTNKIHTDEQAKEAGLSDQKIKNLKQSGNIKCETCAERKYQDGSDEMVSFKSAAHISPEAAASKVRSHEQEHVANAYDKAKEKDGKVISANVSIQTATCPECGRTYVSGGETTTQIKYSEENPYSKNAKGSDYASMVGQKIDYSA